MPSCALMQNDRRGQGPVARSIGGCSLPAVGQLMWTAVCAGMAMAPRAAAALDAFEIQVYDGQANAPGGTSLEIHLNHTLAGRLPKQYAEQVARGHISHATFEFGLGLTDFWELGAYVQAAMPVLPTAELAFGGSKLRSKFVLPQRLAGRWRLGANFEAAYIPLRFDNNNWGGEIRPIIGYRGVGWEAIVNPIIELDLGEPSASTLSPAVKVAHVVVGAWALGFEYYGGTLPDQDKGDLRLKDQYLYAAVDLWDRGWEFNLGVGRGLTAGAQPWVAKAIVGFPLL